MEYHAYHFRTVDRPLTRTARAALRRISGRATISDREFEVVYSWGDLRAAPIDLLDRYFDVYAYDSNFGVRDLAMRLPAATGAELDHFQLGEMTDGSRFAITPTADGHQSVLWARVDTDGDHAHHGGPDLFGARLADSIANARERMIAGDVTPAVMLWLAVAHEAHLDDSTLLPVPCSACHNHGELVILGEYLGLPSAWFDVVFAGDSRQVRSLGDIRGAADAARRAQHLAANRHTADAH